MWKWRHLTLRSLCNSKICLNMSIEMYCITKGYTQWYIFLMINSFTLMSYILFSHLYTQTVKTYKYFLLQAGGLLSVNIDRNVSKTFKLFHIRWAFDLLQQVLKLFLTWWRKLSYRSMVYRNWEQKFSAFSCIKIWNGVISYIIVINLAILQKGNYRKSVVLVLKISAKTKQQLRQFDVSLQEGRRHVALHILRAIFTKLQITMSIACRLYVAVANRKFKIL